MTSDFKEVLKKRFFFSFLIFFLLLRLFPIFILIEDSEDYWYPGVYNCESAHRHTHTHTQHTSHFYINSLFNREPQPWHRDLDSREILFVHFGVTITTPVPHLWQIKMVLNVRTTHPSPSLNKAMSKSWNFFVFLLFSCANPGRCADCKADFQSLPSPHQSGVITRRRRRRDRVCRRTRGSTGWGAGWADTTLAGTSWTRKTLYGKM